MAAPGSRISDLIAEHRAIIDEVLHEVNERIKTDPVKIKEAALLPVDEFTVLKYVLSAARKKSQQKQVAVENIVETLEWRANNKPLLEEARLTREVKPLIPGLIGGWLGYELVLYMSTGNTDANDLWNSLGADAERVMDQGHRVAEATRIIIDEKSRSTGRLHKIIAILDLQGFAVSKWMHMSMFSALGAVTKANEQHTPQITSRTILLHASFAFRTVMSVARPFMNKATIEKFVVCGGKKDETLDKCPFLKQFVNAADSIPTNVPGGKNLGRNQIPPE